MRLIKIKWAGKCNKCQNELNIGDDAGYEKSMGIFCPSCIPSDPEEIRSYRQTRADKKAEKLLSRAEKLEEKAGQLESQFEYCRQDLAWVTQPGNIPGRDRAIRNFEKGIELNQAAKELKERAGSISNVRVAGDAEHEHQAKRDAVTASIRIGAPIFSYIYGNGTVLKINKKTVLVDFGDYKCLIDKCLCEINK